MATGGGSIEVAGAVVRVCEGERRGDEGRRLPGTMRIEASMGNWRNEWTRAFQSIVFFFNIPA